ncbi:MAG: hypothetical protein ACOCWQ_02760 [Nanoarchaeota archaeon]
MDAQTDKMIRFLARYVGDTAGLFLLREMKALGMGTQISTATTEQKKKLISRLDKNLLQKAVSHERRSALRSELNSICGIQDDSMREIDSIGWD